jgi:HD-GYP domain-containing protein (c-di-GMP phosphodiesterase class II)
MKHGSRTGYIFYKILQQRGGYEKFEMAELVMLATLHDIGAYKTDNTDDIVHFETKDFMPHSIYGYLFLKYLSPMDEKSKILLYHHIDYINIKDIAYTYKREAAFLKLAEKIDIYREALGDKYDFSLFEKHKGTQYSEEALELFQKADEQYDLFQQLETEAFEQELDELMDYILFTNEEKRRYMEMLMYCLGLCSPNKVVDSVTSICICEELAKRLYLDEKEIEKLYYGALLHDIGMLAMPREMIEAKRALTPEEIKLMRTHVEISENILKNRLEEDVLEIATAHHERLNGSGYPKGLKEAQMNLLQEILQVADTVTGLINVRAYKQVASRDDVLAVLRKEVNERHFSKQVVETMILFYDDIMEKVKIESGQILLLHKKLERQYELVHEKYQKH